MYYGDYHTHTTFSHGTGSIEDNVKAAIKAGLKEVAVTDHGFGHIAYGVRRREWAVMRAEVERLKPIYPEIEILLGMECNFVSLNGDMDVTEEERSAFDVTMCGYHKFSWPKTFGQAFVFAAPNLWYSLTGLSSAKRKVKCTDAYIKLVEKNEIDILSHVNFAIDSDAVEVAKACKHFGTLVELNGKRVNMTYDEIEKMAQEEVKFIVDSDAHKPEAVGVFTTPQTVIDRLGLPAELIANADKKPVFRSKKK